MAEPTTDFVARYGAIYENSPWVAQRAERHVAGCRDIDTIATVMADCVNNAALDEQLELIRAHPDLAVRAQTAGKLTAESRSEQARAGLDQCTKEEFEKFQILNRAYREKFGFPFVMAVRDSNRAAILAAFEARLGNESTTEFETALAEIHKIARLRLDAIEAA